MTELTDIASENQRQWACINDLTANEIAHNYAVDKARFSLPDAT